MAFVKRLSRLFGTRCGGRYHCREVAVTGGSTVS